MLTELVVDARLKAELARHGLDETRHACLLLERMNELGFRAFRLPPPLDRVDALLARSRAREVRNVYADRGTVSEAELMELMVAAFVVKSDSVQKLGANLDALDGDERTRRLVAELLEDERRHVASLARWMGHFEDRFSRRAVARARERLEAAFVDLDAAYYGALREYFDRVAA